MEAAAKRIEAQLIELRDQNQLQDEAIIDRLPSGIRSTGSVAEDAIDTAPPPKVRDGHRRRSMTELPTEIQFEIFVRMPVKSLLLCKCVCKAFRTLIQNSDFVQAHLTRITLCPRNMQSLILQGSWSFKQPYHHFLLSVDTTTKDIISSLSLTLPFPIVDLRATLHLVGSCNGLILFALKKAGDHICGIHAYYDYDYILWNPVIKQSRLLPKPRHTCTGIFEFGFMPESNDYVVVQFVPRRKVVEVYKMSIDSWILIDCTSFPEPDLLSRIYRHQTPVFINGSFHWTVHGINDIVYYNLRDEKLGVIKGMEFSRALDMPDVELSYTLKKLAVVEQSLAMIYWNWNTEVNLVFEIWVMNECGVRDSWALWFRVVEFPHNDILYNGMIEHQLIYWMNGLMIIIETAIVDSWGNDCDESGTFLLYDINTRSRTIIPRMENARVMTAACSFVETLVPVK